MTEQQIKSQYIGNNGNGTNKMTPAKSFEIHQLSDGYTMEEQDGPAFRNQEMKNYNESMLSTEIQATGESPPKVASCKKKAIADIEKSIDALNARQRTRQLDVEPPRDHPKYPVIDHESGREASQGDLSNIASTQRKAQPFKVKNKLEGRNS